MLFKTVVTLLFYAAALMAQGPTVNGSNDKADVQVGRAGSPLPMHATQFPGADLIGTQYHPVTYTARHPLAGCSDTALCGTIFASGETHNMRTSAGTTWQYNQMAGTTAAVGTYLALTSTAVTPAEADTTLSGEIVANGLTRVLATPTNASAALAVPAAATASVVGTAGSTTYYYWVAACNQGVCTTPSLVSNTITTANATLSTTNYLSVAFTGQFGASSYQVYRTTANTAPSGTVTDLVGGVASCTSPALACTILDVSNTLTSVIIPGSNLTNFGKYTLVNTWTCTTSAQSAQAFGVLNAASSGTLIFEGTFTPVSLNIGDTFQLTETVYM